MIELAKSAEPLNGHGGDRKSEEAKDQVDIVNLKAEGGNHVKYLTDRIARDHPEILDRMKAGEFTSVRQAALEAVLPNRQPTFRP